MQTLDDRLVIRTPEAVEVEVVLAGLGSRGTALILDDLVKGIFMLLTSPFFLAGPAGVAIATVAWFVIYNGYDVFYEVRRSGRTPGKRHVGVRVVSVGGGPVTLRMSALRSILRLVDIATLGLSGAVAITMSERNQRLGDMAAGTLVIRDSFGADTPQAPRRSFRRARAVSRDEGVRAGSGLLNTTQVAAITREELEAMERFIDRRAELPPRVRTKLAASLASRARPRIPGLPPGLSDEALIDEVTAAIVDTSAPQRFTAYDVNAMTPEEMLAMRHFLDRRRRLPEEPRRRLAQTLPSHVRSKVPGGATDLGDEELIEEVVQARAMAY